MMRYFIALLAAGTAFALPTPARLDEALAPRAYTENPITTTTPEAAPVWNPSDTPSGGVAQRSTSTYQCFTSTTYPSTASWLPFDALWGTASATIAANNPTVAGAAALVRAKLALVAQAAAVDARLVLATIMQESGGTLAAACTGDGNCGIMQAALGSASFDAGDVAGSIERMIRDGVEGTGAWPRGGPGLAYWLGVFGEPWKALRAYNTGRVPDAGDLRVTGGVGTASYVVDVANRLVGWDGVTRGLC